MRLADRLTIHWNLCGVFVFLAVHPIHRTSVLGLPLSAAAVNPGIGQQTSTNQTQIEALAPIINELFQTSAQQVAYGWLQGIDPCGTATCTSHTTPPCSWTGLSCNNWQITGVELDPTTVTQPGIPAQLGGTISVYILYLSSLRSLQLADQGLTGTLPRSLGLLTDLQAVDLSSNALTGFLPATFSLLTNLTTLHLNNNSLAGQVPPAWAAMTSLTSLDLRNNTAICNPLPSIPKLVNPATNNITNPTLQFPLCNASVLAAQAAAAGDGSPSPPPAASPSPTPTLVSSPVSDYRMSQGINVSVSVLVGICFLLGLCAGVVRVRQQRRRHQRLLAGLNRARQNRYDSAYTPEPNSSDNRWGWPDLPPYPAADDPYCSTPRLVLGPDGQHLALARKLKQQATDPDTRAASEAVGQQASTAGTGPSAGAPTSSPVLPWQPHISLYTAVLDVDALQTTNPAAPLDLVSPATASVAAPDAVGAQAGAQGSHRSTLRLEGGSSVGPTAGLLSRLSHRLSGQVSSSSSQGNAARQLSQAQSSGGVQDVEASNGVVGSSTSAVQNSGPVQGQGWLRGLPSRWPFHTAA